MRERTQRERRTTRAFDDSWPPLEKLCLTGIRWSMCGVLAAGRRRTPVNTHRGCSTALSPSGGNCLDMRAENPTFPGYRPAVELRRSSSQRSGHRATRSLCKLPGCFGSEASSQGCRGARGSPRPRSEHLRQRSVPCRSRLSTSDEQRSRTGCVKAGIFCRRRCTPIGPPSR